LLKTAPEQTAVHRGQRASACLRISNAGVTKDDTLLVVLIGHGTFDGIDAKFNLVGPDLTARDWKSLFTGVAGQLVVRQHH
jgi:hypothetical protein